jgi:spore coat protein U-like protein
VKKRCSIFYSAIWCCICLSCISPKVLAVCSASATTTPTLISYGTYASQNVPAGDISPNGAAVDANFSVTCSVALSLTLLSTTSWLRYTAQQPLAMSNGTDTISYILGSNATYTPSITSSGQSIGGPTGFQLLTLGLLSAGRVNIPLHVKTATTSIWPSAGIYTGTQTLLVGGSICTGIGLPGVCLGSSPVNSTVTMSMTMTVNKSCEFVSSPALVDFGVVSFLENATTATLSTSLRCTNQEDYLFYPDNGGNFSSGSRAMRSAGGQLIQYQIYHPGSTTVLISSTNPLSRAGTGASEVIALPIRITSGQAAAIEGTYTDSVRMVIEY